MNVLIMFLTVSTLIQINSVKSTKNCNDECLTKTYCLSSDGSNVCSKNNLVTADWSVKQKQWDEVIVLTLTGYGINPTDEKTISLTFHLSLPTTVNTVYSCYKSSLGATSAKVTHSTLSPIISGSSYYSNNILTCTWSFTKDDTTYPLHGVTSVELMTIPDYTLTLQYGDKTPGTIVASDTSELPIYHLQYLKCCYKVHGNNDYLMITNQTTDNQYFVQTFNENPSILLISLTDSNGVKLLFNCYINSYISGSIQNRTESKSISDQLYSTHVTDSRCVWSHPLVLIGSHGRYDTTNGIFDLQISADGVVVYSEKGVPLRNSASSRLLSFTSMMIIIISIFLNWSV